MAPPHKIWFFYDNHRELDCTSVTLNDEQVQSADFDDIAPALSANLGIESPIRSCLTFWKLNEPQDSRLPLNVPLEDLAKQLHRRGAILPYVSRDAPVNLVVRWSPLVPKMEKHSREEARDDVVQHAKRAKIAKESPSYLARPHTFAEWHKNPDERVIDHRRAHDDAPPDSIEGIPPISLQYQGFGHFLDIFRGCKSVPGMEQVSSPTLRSAVDDFAEEMSLIYPSEKSRHPRCLHALSEILSSRTDNIPAQLQSVAISGNAIADGLILGPHKAATCIVEIKIEAAGSSIPYVEMSGYFAHSIREMPDKFTPVVRGWNLPCLGLTIIGHYVTFYAMIYFGRWRVVALTPGLSCIWASGDGDDRNALYNAFTAASVLLACINKDALQLVATTPPPIQEGRDLPSISSLPHPRSGSRIEFKILELFFARAIDQLLYIARTTDGKIILVKFTRCYSYELHMFCADRGHAPNLLGFERLPGGFFAIAMDYLSSASQIADFTGPRVSEWKKQLQVLVRSFHAENLVHGDLRGPNILCEGDGDKVMLIDFDWAGKEGVVCYPDIPLNVDLTDGRDSTDLKVTKADDLRVLCKTLMSMGLECDYCTSKSV